MKEKLTRKSKLSNLEVEQWNIYSFADLLIAVALVLIALANAEPPRFRSLERQSSPYHQSGWRPQGAAFSLPQQAYPPPPQTYGPPEEPTTTEIPTTTEAETEETVTDEPQFERLRDGRKPAKLQEELQTSPIFLLGKAPKIQEQPETSPVYYLAPQRQNYLYAYQRNAALVAVPQNGLSSSKLQAVPVREASIYAPYQTYFQIYQ